MDDLRRRGEIERQIVRRMSREMAQLRRELLEEFQRYVIPGGRISDGFWLLLRDRLEGVTRPALVEVYLEAATEFQEQFRYGIDDMRTLEAAEAWAEDRAQVLVRQMERTTQTRLDRVIERYFETSMNNRELQRQLTRVLGAQRAETATITEVTRASAAGRQRMANELRAQGVQLRAVWQTLVDERVCPICGPRHGTVQGTEWFDLPPAHVRCRCFVNYEVVEDD